MMVHCGITYVVSQRVFRVQYEFRRLAVMLAAAVALTLAAPLLPPGILGIVGQVALWLAWPALLWWGNIIAISEKSMIMAACSRARRWAACLVP